MFNNTTNIFIDTLVSLQKLDDLERLINPNSAFFQSYRNSLNEINLNYLEEKSLHNYDETKPQPKGLIQPIEPIEHRFATRYLPSLEFLPSVNTLNKLGKSTPVHDKENESICGTNNLELSIQSKQRIKFKSGFKRVEPLAEKSQEQKSKFSFQKVDNIKTSKDIKPSINAPNASKCTCTNSRCLKLYCACFSSGDVCGPQCQCKSCYNNENNTETRQKIIEETLQKNPNAFQSKYKKHLKKDAVVHVRGCNCSKTGCIKEYCECFKIGTGCSRLCKCINCQNKKLDLQTEEVKEYFVKAIRKRRKTKFYEDKFGNNRKNVNAHAKTNIDTTF